VFDIERTFNESYDRVRRILYTREHSDVDVTEQPMTAADDSDTATPPLLVPKSVELVVCQCQVSGTLLSVKDILLMPFFY